MESWVIGADVSHENPLLDSIKSWLVGMLRKAYHEPLYNQYIII